MRRSQEKADGGTLRRLYAGCHYHDYDGCEEEVDIESYKEARKGDLADNHAQHYIVIAQ